MIDFVVESGEYEGELMEFIGYEEWSFFEIEGRSRPERYSCLEGFLEDNFGLQSIYNAKGENTLYVGKVVWSTIGTVESNQNPEINLLNGHDEHEIKERVLDVKTTLNARNEYWSDSLPEVNYYWMRGTDF
jgi:hypothetical protein